MFLNLTYLPERLCLYGDLKTGKSQQLLRCFDLLDAEDKVYMESWDGRDLSQFSYVFLDYWEWDVNTFDGVPYIFTTNRTPLEGFFNYPVYSQTNAQLYSKNTDLDIDLIYCCGGAPILVNELDLSFKDYWKGFCRILFNYSSNTIENSLNYLHDFKIDYFYTWLIFLRLIIEKGTSNPIILSRIRTFSTHLYLCRGKITLDDFKNYFVDGVYTIYNNISKFPYRDKLNSLILFVD